jgi:hypothetical protein
MVGSKFRRLDTARISFRVFGVFGGYIPGSAAWPAVVSRLDRLAGNDLREDERHDAARYSGPGHRVAVARPGRWVVTAS